MLGTKDPKKIKDRVVKIIMKGKGKNVNPDDLRVAFNYLADLAEFLRNDISRLNTSLPDMPKGSAGYRQTSLDISIKQTDLDNCQSELLMVKKEYELRFGRKDTDYAKAEVPRLKAAAEEKLRLASEQTQAVEASEQYQETEKEADKDLAEAKKKRPKVD